MVISLQLFSSYIFLIIYWMSIKFNLEININKWWWIFICEEMLIMAKMADMYLWNTLMGNFPFPGQVTPCFKRRQVDQSDRRKLELLLDLLYNWTCVHLSATVQQKARIIGICVNLWIWCDIATCTESMKCNFRRIRSLREINVDLSNVFIENLEKNLP